MNYSIIRYMLGLVSFLTGICMLLPLFIAVLYRENEGTAYLLCSSFCIILGLLLTLRKPNNTSFFAREGFFVVALSWVLISLVGAMPFFVSGEFNSYTDALFEIVSGFTTTGASVCNDVEALSHSTLMWRSFSHWIGGMGVLVFLIALLPSTGGQTLYFMKAESPGPSVGKQVPRMQNTAKLLYIIFAALTFAEFVFLAFGDMNIFDALCASFATAGTGGFGNYGDSMGSFSTYTQVVITVFMMLFGINFNFYFLLIYKRSKEAFKIEEVKWYLSIYAIVVALITLNITRLGGNLLTNLRDAAFQSASVMTTTGFCTVNFDNWPTFSKSLMILLMIIGACAGSTGGGIKVSRIMIYLKSVKKELQHLVHPQHIKVLSFEHKPLPHDVLRSANIFLIAYCSIFIVSFIIVSLDNFDGTTTFTAVLATLNNIGPGLAKVGPVENFDKFSDLSKFVFMFDMLAGRLEIFPMLVLISPAAWARRKS
ncbi:MAG: TrkH family potassium uptake protein [Lachnospiraceae bacterium]|nr:TrkH family potassium uptake protein [Lachnospiraceae bacterium]